VGVGGGGCVDVTRSPQSAPSMGDLIVIQQLVKMDPRKMKLKPEYRNCVSLFYWDRVPMYMQ